MNVREQAERHRDELLELLEIPATGVVAGVAYLDSNGNGALDASDEILEDVVVELVLGHTRGEESLYHPRTVELTVEGEPSDGRRVFVGSYAMERSGNYAYGVRVRPRPAHWFRWPRTAMRYP